MRLYAGVAPVVECSGERFGEADRARKVTAFSWTSSGIGFGSFV